MPYLVVFIFLFPKIFSDSVVLTITNDPKNDPRIIHSLLIHYIEVSIEFTKKKKKMCDPIQVFSSRKRIKQIIKIQIMMRFLKNKKKRCYFQ